MFGAFSKNTIFSGLFFFFVLFSLFITRPFRSAIAADIGTQNLPMYLILIVLVMVAANLIYSYTVSKVQEKRIVTYVYSFLLINMFIFLLCYQVYPDSFILRASFYVWYNIFNFFVVAVFWARTINCFDKEEGKRNYGIISAFGTFGGWLAGILVTNFLYDQGEEVSIGLSALSLGCAMYLSSKLSPKKVSSKANIGILMEQVFEQFKQIRLNKNIQYLVSYGFFWTCLSTALYFFNLEIINAYTDDTSRKVQIFSFADNIVLPLTLLFQASSILILTNKRLGLRFVLGLYGIFFAISFTLMSLHFSQLLFPASGIILFYLISLFQRPYEYGLNKPAREVAYTTLSKTEKYKSTVIIDTLINRSGDASGGILFNMIISFGIILYAAPLLVLPLAGILVFIGIRIANRVEIVKK